MAKLPKFITFSLQNLTIFALLQIHLHLLQHVSSSFTPIDHYLINCGSFSPSISDKFNRIFTGDESPSSDSFKLSSTRTIPLTESSPSSDLYNSVRIFTEPSSYSFQINQKGPHFVRLHFRRLNFDKFDGKDVKFHVLAGDFVLLNDFSLLNVGNDVEIREFILWVDSDHLELSFVPVENTSFGFVSAIELISAPKDLILDIATAVNSSGITKIDGMIKNGYETVYRVNVGGPKITPFNDSLWRTWVSDDGFLKSSGESRDVRFTGRIKYQFGGASREIAPDHVYGSARVIGVSDSVSLRSNLTWTFPVLGGYKHLLRAHFCDIVSPVLGSLYFNVYVNGILAYEDLDLSRMTGSLASPFYADFVVDGGEDGVVSVSVGNSDVGGNAILNGVEVFRMSNAVKSFDGVVSAKCVMGRLRGEEVGFPLIFVIAIGVLLAVSLLLRKILATVQESVAWSRLPTDVSEVALKSSNR